MVSTSAPFRAYSTITKLESMFEIGPETPSGMFEYAEEVLDYLVVDKPVDQLVDGLCRLVAVQFIPQADLVPNRKRIERRAANTSGLVFVLLRNRSLKLAGDFNAL
jgi:hypothetical protein